ncbi:transcription elongation factor B polypeptide 3 [Scaptodrosophila lebanonensis]|uniref:Transcription elongation factor B polypeptide 3 n=1 Tax=Drosophila lebanonensis TaxID=7225 RepID=A0A6J2T0B8_DROLE|nr:transcription elongation factor B polypeptide 3 [Scaptodrosophila lebanonensis]
MTSTSNLADVVRHYQRSIERHGQDETRLLHCITKLFNLPIKFEHLQETGIGKTVNTLRKINGEVGIAAKTLVTKWKAMVAAEEEPIQPATHNSNEEDSNRSNGRRSSDEDLDQNENGNKGSNTSSSDEMHFKAKSNSHEERSRERESNGNKTTEHKIRSSSSNHHHSSNSKSNSKTKSDGEKKHKSSRHDKAKNSERRHESHKDERSNGERMPKESTSAKVESSSKSSSDESRSKHRHHSKSESHKSGESKVRSSTHEKTKEHKSHSVHSHSKDKSSKHKSSSSGSAKSAKRARSSDRTVDEVSPKPKIAKTKTKAEALSNEDTADGFDSTMGANFDDVLGMLNVPMSSKKSSSKPKTPNKATSTTTASKKAHRSPAAELSSSIKLTTTTTRKPDLLASTAKLEPLDPSIALELPTISNNYKPMPLNQTVMDVVFNSGSNNSHKPVQRNFDESEALAHGISSKTMRTKIYSGVKTGQILQVPSLFDLCIRILQKNIDALEYTGGVPFEVLRPVLERATPQQLLNFEEYNPYLMDDSDVLWQHHVQRHHRSQKREEMETWREMFLRCQEEKDRKLSILAESIKASQKISEAPVRKTQLAFVDSMVKPPRNVQRKQEQYGTKGKLIATPAARVTALSSVTPNAAKVGDARLRVAASARDTAQVAVAPMRPKKAPLMAKTLQFMRGRHKR